MFDLKQLIFSAGDKVSKTKLGVWLWGAVQLLSQTGTIGDDIAKTLTTLALCIGGVGLRDAIKDFSSK